MVGEAEIEGAVPHQAHRTARVGRSGGGGIGGDECGGGGACGGGKSTGRHRRRGGRVYLNRDSPIRRKPLSALGLDNFAVQVGARVVRPREAEGPAHLGWKRRGENGCELRGRAGRGVEPRTCRAPAGTARRPV